MIIVRNRSVSLSKVSNKTDETNGKHAMRLLKGLYNIL